MATNHTTETETAGTGRLVKDIVKDVETLAEQHIHLLKADLKEDLHHLREGALALAVGVAVMLIGGFLLGTALALLVALAFPADWQWLAFALVGLLFASAGGLVLYLGQRKVESASPLAENTLETLEEDVEWMKNPK